MQQRTSESPGDWKSGTCLTTEPRTQLGFSPGSGAEVAPHLPRSQQRQTSSRGVRQQAAPRANRPSCSARARRGRKPPGWAGAGGWRGRWSTWDRPRSCKARVARRGGLPTAGAARRGGQQISTCVGWDGRRVTQSCAPGMKRNPLMVLGDGRSPGGSADSGCFRTFSLIREEKGSRRGTGAGNLESK